MEPILTETVGDLTVNVYVDDTGVCGNPREDCEPLGCFWGGTRRYVSPDDMPCRDLREALAETFGVKLDRLATLPDTLAAIRAKGAVILPVWLYEHSGTCYRAAEDNPFSCPWDSGLFGFIFVTAEALRREYKVKRLSPRIKAQAAEVLAQEVKTYGAWASGDVFGFRVENADGEEVDSCWGFIGEPEHALAEGMEAARA